MYLDKLVVIGYCLLSMKALSFSDDHLPLYDISYQYFGFIGCVVTILVGLVLSIITGKVQVGKDQKRRNQKKIPTPKTEVGKNKLTIRYLYHENISYLNLTKI